MVSRKELVVCQKHQSLVFCLADQHSVEGILVRRLPLLPVKSSQLADLCFPKRDLDKSRFPAESGQFPGTDRQQVRMKHMLEFRLPQRDQAVIQVIFFRIDQLRRLCRQPAISRDCSKKNMCIHKYFHQVSSNISPISRSH